MFASLPQTIAFCYIFCQIVHVKLPFFHPVGNMAWPRQAMSLRLLVLAVLQKKCLLLTLGKMATSTAVTQIALGMLTAK